MTRTIEIEQVQPEPLPVAARGDTIDLAPIPRLLEALGVKLDGGHIMQLGSRGCFGIGELLETYRPRRIVAYEMGNAKQARGQLAIDSDPQQRIPERDDAFHAVFVYGFMELRSHWCQALAEIARVLAPRGVMTMQGSGDIAPTNASFRELSLLLRRAGLALAVNKTFAATKGHVLIARRVNPV